MNPLTRSAPTPRAPTGMAPGASAGVWELAFSAALFLIGLLGSGLVVALLIVPEWRVTQQFLPADCRVLDARLGTTVRDDQTLYRAEILIEYALGGRTYRTWTYDIHTARGNGYVAERAAVEAVVRQYGPGGFERTTCWYDPLHPEVAVLQRGYRWWVWLVFSIPLSLLLIGSWGVSVGLWRRGKSAERLAVQGVPLEVLRLERRHRESEYPFVPEIRPAAIAPGERLAYRLPAGTASVRATTAWLAAALFWNAMLAALVATAVSRGPLHWSFPLFVIPCGAVGIALPAVYVRQSRLIRAMGRTAVEVSAFPPVTGGRFQVYIIQTGRLRLHWFEVLLVCEEEAIFQHGTNLRRESRRVWQKTLLRHEKLEIMPHVPFECEAEAAIPPAAMHSFKSAHNEVRWRLCVRVSAEKYPVFERTFPLVVLPGERHRRDATSSTRSAGTPSSAGTRSADTALIGTPAAGIGEREVEERNAGEQDAGEQDGGGRNVGDAASDRAAGALKPSMAPSGAPPGTDLSPLTAEDGGGAMPDPTQAADGGETI